MNLTLYYARSTCPSPNEDGTDDEDGIQITAGEASTYRCKLTGKGNGTTPKPPGIEGGESFGILSQELHETPRNLWESQALRLCTYFS